MVNKRHNNPTQDPMDTVPETPTTPTVAAPANSESISYQCPCCGDTYTHEILTRTHITRTDDTQHVNKDGFKPEIPVNLLDENGAVIHTATHASKNEVNPTQLTIDDLPSNLSAQHKHAVLVAAHNPHEQQYTEIASTANSVLREKGLTEFSYSSVRRAVQNFFTPDDTSESEDGSKDVDSHLLGDFTTTQQAVIIASVVHSDDTIKKLAERADASMAYPSQVLGEHEDIVDELHELLTVDTSVEEVLALTLPPRDAVRLKSAGYFERIDVDWDALQQELSSGPGTAPVVETGAVVTPDDDVETVDSDTVRAPTTSHTPVNTSVDPDEDTRPGCIDVDDVREIRDTAQMYREMLASSNDVEAYEQAFEKLTMQLERIVVEN